MPLSRRRTVAVAAVVVILLLGDAWLISLDVLYRRGVIADSRFDITLEWSFGEWLQYLKTGTVALVLLFVSWSMRSVAQLFWVALFALLVIDDAFEVHEQIGEHLAHRLALPEVFGLRAVDLGELIYFAGMGALLVAGVAAILRWGSPSSVGLALALTAGLVVFAAFGVGVDAVHIALRDRWVEPALASIEDGGEMIATTLLVGIAAAYAAGFRLRIMSVSAFSVHVSSRLRHSRG